MKRSLALAACAILSGCVGMRPPGSFPNMIPHTSHDAVVVVKTSPGDYLPQFPECEGPDVICMDPPPFWFRAQVLSVLFGTLDRTSIIAATTSHYGMEVFAVASEDPALLRLVVDGSAIVMPRYAQTALYASRGGDLFLIFQGPEPIWWLPCSVMEAAVDIDPAEFTDDLLIPVEYVPVELIAGSSEFLTRTCENPRRNLRRASRSNLDCQVEQVRRTIWGVSVATLHFCRLA